MDWKLPKLPAKGGEQTAVLMVKVKVRELGTKLVVGDGVWAMECGGWSVVDAESGAGVGHEKHRRRI